MTERLEEIQSRVWKDKGTYAMGDNKSREGYIYTLSDYDYEWLIKQAELVETIAKLREEDSTYYNILLTKLRGQNERYKQALETIRNMFPMRGGTSYDKLSQIRKTAEKALEDDKNDR